MEFIKEELLAMFTKAWVFLLYIFIGLVGMFSHNFILGRKLTRLQIFGSIGMALFCGFIASMMCYNNFPEYAAYIVPTATLLSEKLVIAALSIDYKKLMADLASYFANKYQK